MWKLIWAALSVMALGVGISAPAWGSWAQVDEATKDGSVKGSTNEGSKAFLNGAIGVAEAMRKLDEGDTKGAVTVGSKAADQFDEARKHFEAARDRISRVKEIDEELRKYLASVDFQKKAATLGAGIERSSLWISVQRTAVERGGVGLFDSAATRAKSLHGTATLFFKVLGTKDQKPTQGAAILGQLGADLAFGGYVSAVFTRE